jgi:putative membrane protein
MAAPDRATRMLANPGASCETLPAVTARQAGTKHLVLLAHAGLVGGLALFTALIAYEGVRDVAHTLASAGVGLLWVTLFHLAPLLASALGWYALFAPGERPPFRTFAWARWIAESINQLLPALHVGGNIVRAQLLARRGVAGTVAGASVVADITLHLSGQLLFTLLGLCLLLAHVGGRALAGPVVLGLGVMALMVGAFFVVQRRGVFGAMARVIAHLVHTSDWSSLSANADALDRTIRTFYAEHRRVAVSSLWHLSSWLLGAGEIWLALYFLGQPVDLATALVIESLGEAIHTAAFTVPGALGVQEGGFLLLGRTFGFPPDVSIALSLAKRVREISLGVPGLVAWQIQGASTILATRGRTPAEEKIG